MTAHVKYFTRPLRLDNFKSHLRTHKSKWEEHLELCSGDDKKNFFDSVPVLYVNTLNAHFNVERSKCSFCFDADIIEKLIGNMFLDD